MKTALVALVLAFCLPPAFAQGHDPQKAHAARQQAIGALAFLDGTWRGRAWSVQPGGEKVELTQTERVGPFLDGSLKVVEGRGYDASGKVVFNAFGIISYDPARQAYTMRAYTLGSSGDFPVTVREDGFSWEIDSPRARIVYNATVKDGTWHEVGDYLAPGAAPRRFFEMKLERVGKTDWPSGSPVPAR